MRHVTLPNLLLLVAVGHLLALYAWGVLVHPWWTCGLVAGLCAALWVCVTWAEAREERQR